LASCGIAALGVLGIIKARRFQNRKLALHNPRLATELHGLDFHGLDLLAFLHGLAFPISTVGPYPEIQEENCFN
jgi:hypothetical protein